MPSGPPELHEKWKSDANAMKYLQERGYILGHDWYWRHPDKASYADLTEEEYEAVCYLVWEWDYGGFTKEPYVEPGVYPVD